MSKFNETRKEWLVYLAFATVWNSLVAWIFVGLYVLVTWAFGHPTLNIYVAFGWWGLVLALGYLSIWRDET